MLSWKEKVAGKISRLLSDSPPSSPLHFVRDSPIVRPDTEVMPLTSEELCGPETSSYSSYLFSLLPAVNRSFDGSKSNKLTGQHDITSSPLRLLPSKRKSKNFAGKHRSLDHSADCGLDCERNETMKTLGVDIGHVSQKNINGSTKCEEASTSLKSLKFLPDLMDESSFISSTLFEFLQSSLPNIVKGCQWVLLYSTLKHGISLRTLLRNSVDLPGPCLLIVGDMQGAVFGGLLECPLKPTTKRKYQGTNQTFVFTTIYGAPRLFRATGANRYYYLCLDDLLALGGGGSFALCLDGDLLNGTSGPCETFGNLCLAHNQEFELKNVELWGFTHSMQYLT